LRVRIKGGRTKQGEDYRAMSKHVCKIRLFAPH
jgi:hypothetical protein